jgi:alpha-N-arabinofuranosidase
MGYRNTNSTAVLMDVKLESSWTSVNGTIITADDPNAFNYRNNQTAVAPLPLNLASSVPATNGSWSWSVP